MGIPPSRPPEAPCGCSQDLRTAHRDGLRTPDPLFHSAGCSAPRGPGPPHRWAAALLSQCLRAILGSLSQYLSTDGTVNHN